MNDEGCTHRRSRVRRVSHSEGVFHEHGHEVTALVRDDAQADIVRAAPGGATPAVVDLYDRPTVVKLLHDGRSRAHCQSRRRHQPPPWIPPSSMPPSTRSPARASRTSRSAVCGSGTNSSITENSPFNAPVLVSWKEPIERRVLGTNDVRGVVITSGTAYGDGGGGIPGLLLGSPRDDDGNLIMVGTGRQHWSTVHVADLAEFFRRVLEQDSARGRYVVGDGSNATVAELTDAAAVAAGTQVRFPVPTTKHGRVSATTSPRSSSSTRARSRPRLAPSSTGILPARRSSTSFATAATAHDSRHTEHLTAP